MSLQSHACRLPSPPAYEVLRTVLIELCAFGLVRVRPRRHGGSQLAEPFAFSAITLVIGAISKQISVSSYLQ